MKEIIEFFRNGKFCKEFGHEMKTERHYDDTDKLRCKYCSHEEWT